jgi:hypothetical protein
VSGVLEMVFLVTGENFFALIISLDQKIGKTKDCASGEFVGGIGLHL